MKFGPYVLKTTFVFALLAAGFSLIGLILPWALPPENPLESATVEHIIGHIVWGMVAAFATLSLRHIFAGGLFALILDADHFVSFLDVDIVNRMGHSILFALLAPIVMLLIFGRRDLLLGSITFAAVFSHMSFDTFLDDGKFPILTPFSDLVTSFEGMDWVILQLIGISVIILAKLVIEKERRIKKKLAKED